MINASATHIAHEASNSSTLQLLARLGFAVNGLLHILIGSIAITVAVGAGGGSADQSGALGQLGSSPGGVFLLWTVVVGMFALGLWLLVSAFVMQGDPKRKWSRRFANLAKAVVYFALGVTALTFARGGSASSASSTQSASSSLLASPGGIIVLFLLGVAVLGVAGYFVYKGAAQKFRSDLAVPSGTVGRVVIALGVVGYIAKGVALGVVAILIGVAALTRDASKSTGLDGALKALAALPFGTLALLLIGSGLIAYGIYCFVRARRAQL
ncbi:MAG: DUF1206 domain-containing protein [Cryobacterium sp.]|uniref:DUF1206 domain-containing protein n=1 Tax=unclassified Cryobacterium TaxID=2649013 RepID=UPI001A2E0AA8|nr:MULTISPECIES: DUF1206 domain-containing protein [unclassified Cryobacterium]MCY7404161.1 DUF1206 domain-containing protein [Cryobacterium sp.]MEC5154369.1 hypothetical protein [Cryobacterium sp. CAN_C3]